MIEIVKPVVTPVQLKTELPLSDRLKQIKEANDALLRDIILNKDKRFLVVSGPCSADDPDAMIEYALRLKKLNAELSDKLVIMPRVFTAKPRTTGEGYLGMMYQPYGEQVDLNEGLRRSRKMMLDVIEVSELPISDELLYPEYYDYHDDLVSYYFIGARSSENPEHRNLASGLDVAVGVKNSTGGNLLSLAGSVHACQFPKTFLLKGNEVKTQGNSYAHAVLRGFVDESGVFYTNYSKSSLDALAVLCREYGAKESFVLVDCSHANSAKQSAKQAKAAISVVVNKHPTVGGIMLESYLFEGCGEGYGVSKTDSCLSWESTEEVIRTIHSLL